MNHSTIAYHSREGNWKAWNDEDMWEEEDIKAMDRIDILENIVGGLP